MKYKKVQILLVFLLAGSPCFSQNGLEREHRILNSQFPKNALMYIGEKVEGTKKVRYYREIDSTQKIYTAKFKKDRLHYDMAFDENGNLKSIGFRVKKIDIPEDTYTKIQSYLKDSFEDVKIKRILQQYHANNSKTLEKTLQNAFQNLLLPSNLYKLLIVGKKKGKRLEYEVIFDADGTFMHICTSLPANYDHVLY